MRQLRFLGALALCLCTLCFGDTAPFSLHLSMENPKLANLDVTIAPDHMLYQDRFILQTPQSGQLGPIQWPAPSYTPEGRAIYTQSFKLKLPVQTATPFALQIQYQGCAADGVCYPAATQVEMIPPTAGTSTLLALPWFILLGLLLAFTPCIWPMIPILSGILVGNAPKSRAHAFQLAGSYVLGMATTYAAFGFLVARLGHSFQSSLQSFGPKAAFAMVLVFLTTILWEWLPFRMPEWRLKHIKTGAAPGALILGMGAALVASPCLTPPLVGIFSYILTTGNVLHGSAALFLFGLGMGLPLLFIGTFGSRWLPRSGPWLQHVNTASGIAMLSLALWFVWPYLHHTAHFFLIAILAVLALLRVYQYQLRAPVILLFLLALGALFYSGRTTEAIPAPVTLMAPAGMAGIEPAAVPTQIVFAPLQSEAVHKLHAKQCILFTAAWCPSCVKYKSVLASDEVQAALQDWECFVVDLTQPTAQTKILQDHFGIFGVPALILYRHDGTQAQLVGAQSKETLVKALKMD